jgi:hypothetical protein
MFCRLLGADELIFVFTTLNILDSVGIFCLSLSQQEINAIYSTYSLNVDYITDSQGFARCSIL